MFHEIFQAYSGTFFLVILALSSLGLAACEEEGTAEKMGKELDKTMEDLKDKVE